MAQNNNLLVDAINKDIHSHDDGAGAPTFTLASQRKFNAFNAGLVKRSALHFAKEPPSYSSPKPPEQVGIAGVPFYTSFKSRSVSELQKERATAAVQQMGSYKPPSEFSFREEQDFTVNRETTRADTLRREIQELEARDTSTMSSTQKYGLKQTLKRKKAALVKESADFSCKFGLDSIQALKKKVAINQDGIFDEKTLQPGDQVLVHFPSELECWKGPFTVVNRVNACLFTVRSQEFGQHTVDVARLQDMRMRSKTVPPTEGKKHFVLNVGRSTAKDVVVGLAKEAGSNRGPYNPPSAYNFVEYESDAAAFQRLNGSTTTKAELELTEAEKSAEERRKRFNETKRKAARV